MKQPSRQGWTELLGVLIAFVVLMGSLLGWDIIFRFLGGIMLPNTAVLILLAIFLLFLLNAIKIVREYERVVIFRLGRLQGAKGPGLFFIIPIIDQVVKVDLRTVTFDVPPQEVITRDNVTVSVNAIVFFRVMAPDQAITEVEDYLQATSQIAQTTLRSVLGQVELDELLAEREKLNKQLQAIIDEQTDPWGIKVKSVEIKDVRIPQDMQRAMARQAEAERERRSKIINAEGEQQAAQKLREAAEILQQNPASLQLRYLQTIVDISTERNTSTIVFPLPVDLLKALMSKDGK
jgi:regulator of protease activity HflC (stomatin/prohibitin superfamily)